MVRTKTASVILAALLATGGADTSVTVVAWAGSLHGVVVDVVAPTPGGDATLPNGFAFLGFGSPTIAAVGPDTGLAGGGTRVTLTGTRLLGTTSVTFGGASAPIVGVPTATSVTVTAPPSTVAGPAEIRPTAPAGLSILPDGFTYLAPRLTSITPAQGPLTGGTAVTLTGTGLAKASGVTFGGAPGTDVVVDSPGSDADAASGFVGTGATVTDVSPSTVSTGGGTFVTISGTGLDGATGVTFGGEPGTAFSMSPDGTSVGVVTPPHADATVDVVVALPGLDATVPRGFRYVASAPTIGSMSPPSGPATGGQTLIVTGTGFVPGATTVTVDGNPATGVQVINATTLIAVTPAGAVGQADVVVTVAGVSSNSIPYEYTDGPPVPPAPTVDRVDPDRGPTVGGTTVTVVGSNLIRSQTSAVICGILVPASQVDVNEAGTAATFATPPCSEGDTQVRLVTPGGGSNVLTFTYDDDGLPITGASVSIALLVGVSLLSIGLLIVVALWRRKDRLH